MSTATAMLLGVDRTHVRAGLLGFNGGLVAIALLYFLQPDGLTWGCLIFAAACSAIVMPAARFGRLESMRLLPTAGLPKAVAVEGVVTASTIIKGLFNGIA